MQLRVTTAVALATGLTSLLAALLIAPPIRAADRPETDADIGPDMRILTTPEEVHFRVTLGGASKRFRPQKLGGAQGWSVRLAPNRGGAAAAWPTPATDGERVFVGGPLTSSEFFAVRAETGTLSWRAHLADNGPTPATVRDRRVVFNTQSCTLYSYDARTGTRLWSKYLANHLESIPAVDDDSIVTTRPERHGRSAKKGGNLPALTVLNRRGRIQSDTTIDGEAVGGPVLHGGNAFVATREGTLYCVNIDEGKEQWSRKVQARGAPWVDDSGVYVATDASLQAFHPATGTPRWTHQAVTPSSRDGDRPPRRTMAPPPLRPAQAAKATTDAFWGEGMRPVRVGGGELCIAEGRALRFFDRVTGAEVAYWELDVEHDFAGAPIVAGDTVIVSTHGGEVRGVNTRHGEIVWAVDIGQPLGSGVVVDDGKLYAVTRDGRLVCVQTGDLSADGWPMWGGTPEHAAPATR